MRVIQADQKALIRIMQDIEVDKYGIEIMLPKALNYLIRVNNLSNITANILKQEMLSLGADAAVSRNALTGKTKKTDCLLMANLSQLNRLNNKLKLQPFDLGKLSNDLRTMMRNYERDNFVLKLGKYILRLGRCKCIMGIVNLTPDSFSQDGLMTDSRYYKGGRACTRNLIEHIKQMVRDGADIIDIGGESSRPGSRAVSAKEEISRVIPVLKKIVKKIKVPISIDTYKPEVAKAALDCGVNIVNDITGLQDKKMLKLISRYDCAVVIMHMKGRPQTMQNNPKYKSLLEEIIAFLEVSIKRAQEAGIDREKIIIDPGIGFGKGFEHNLVILNSLKEFRVLGRPILVGTSRKSFIGTILNVPSQQRIYGTLSSCVLAAMNGAHILRVHDVGAVKQALRVVQAITKA